METFLNRDTRRASLGALPLHIFRAPFPKNTVGGLLLHHAWKMTKVHRDFPILWGLWCVNSFQTSVFHFFHVLGLKVLVSILVVASGSWSLDFLELFRNFLVLEMYLKNATFWLSFLNCIWILNFRLKEILKTSSKIPFLLQLKENFRKAINTNLNKSYDQ